MHEFVTALTYVVGPALAWSAYSAYSTVRWRFRRRRGAVGLGERVPNRLALRSIDGRPTPLSHFNDARVMVIVFMSNRCPGVKAYDARLARLQAAFRDERVAFLGINPVDEGLYPDESLDNMAKAAEDRDLSFPYLKDPRQELTRALGATCTPHVFVLDEARRLRYRGRIDDAFVESRVTRSYLKEAIDDLLAGREVRLAETAPLGCSFDWRITPSPAATSEDAARRSSGLA